MVIGWKEKWGEVRVTVAFRNGLWSVYEAYVYRQAYKKALKKWPHLRQEMIDGAGYEQLLEGL